MILKVLHAADLHLDSPFEGLPAGKAAIRRAEQRQLLSRLAELAVKEDVDLVLLSGDLLDSDSSYYETGEELVRCLRQMPMPVFIAPGNHDPYTRRSPYARLRLPDNVHVFSENAIRGISLPELNAVVYGAAFPSARRSWSRAAWTTWLWAISTRPGACATRATPGTAGPAARRAAASTSAGKRP